MFPTLLQSTDIIERYESISIRIIELKRDFPGVEREGRLQYNQFSLLLASSQSRSQGIPDIEPNAHLRTLVLPCFANIYRPFRLGMERVFRIKGPRFKLKAYRFLLDVSQGNEIAIMNPEINKPGEGNSDGMEKFLAQLCI